MKILLHICCAVCAGACVERLKEGGYQVSGYFYNPNIQPEDEYSRRLEAAEQVAQRMDFPLIVGEYDMEEWSARIKGLEKEPEGGKRCSPCFRLRLEETLRQAKDKGFDFFTTTLSVSPHKNTRVINDIGRDIGQELFLTSDFKKQDGFQRAQILARELNLYRQNYCGCIYSRRQKNEQIQ